MSASRITAPTSASSSSSARRANATVRSLRPATVAITRAPPRRRALPTALPIAPGLTIPTVAIGGESTASKARCPASGEDRVDDRRVAGAAAEVAGQLRAHLLLGRRGILLEEEPRGHQDPRCAEAALKPEVLVEGLLERVELGAVRERLDRLDLRPVRLHREREARPRRASVEQDRAGAADAVLAPDVRAVEVQLVADEVGEQQARLDQPLVADPVDRDRDGDHARTLSISASATTRL